MVSLNRAVKQLFHSGQTKKANIGYDNPRENIDPKIRTKVIISKEGIYQKISGMNLYFQSGQIMNAPSLNKDIVNKGYADANYNDKILLSSINLGSIPGPYKPKIFTQSTAVVSGQLVADEVAIWISGANNYIIRRYGSNVLKVMMT